MATLLRCFRDAKLREQVTVTKDATNSAPQKVAMSESWRVVYDGKLDNPLTVLSATDPATHDVLPIIGSVSNGLVCTRVNPIRSATSPHVWDVSVDWQSLQQPGGTTSTGNWNINLRRGSVAREETAVQDRLGLPLVNTFGDLLPQLPNVTLYDELLTISWSTSNVPFWSDTNYEGMTNIDSVTFTICSVHRSFAKSQMKCTGMALNCNRTQTGGDNSNPIYTIHYDCELSFQVRKPKWVWYAPNEGYRGYADHTALSNSKPDTFRDKNTPCAQPQKIDRDGIRLPTGTVPIRLPDGMIGIAAGGPRQYVEDGAFEIEQQAAFASLFTGLNDGEQHP